MRGGGFSIFAAVIYRSFIAPGGFIVFHGAAVVCLLPRVIHRQSRYCGKKEGAILNVNYQIKNNN